MGQDNIGKEVIMGKHGCGNLNENGEKLVNLGETNNLAIGGSLFPHKNIHKLTWVSNDGVTINQIDHILINRKWKSSLNDVRVYRKADEDSDHYLLVANIKLKLKKYKGEDSETRGRKFDIIKLRNKDVRKAFVLKLKNRFAVLAEADDAEDKNVEDSWNDIKSTYCKAAEETLGFTSHKRKQWITESTWQAIQERKELKLKVASANSARIREARRIEHAQKRREVKRKAKADKKKHVDDLAEEAEVAASKGNMGQVYKISKQLCGKFGQATNSTVKTKAGRVLTTEKEQRERWKQHFQEVLNRPEPEEPAEPEPAVTNLEIETAAPKEAEVLEAVLAMKNNKAPGIDMIQAEMLKVDPKLSSKVLTEFFKKVWDGETIPGDWSKGIIIKIPKKGDKGNCDNWRGITLLSIPSKILCRIILKRMYKAIDKELRE